jgi:LmbE family N-acetylglucosaminyl deacetylase
MQWIYISPHPDDVALSCGGLVWEQSRSGDLASIWTICAGDPPLGMLSPFAQSLHQRWGTGSETFAERREEDIESCAQLDASYRHYPITDCIYRQAPHHMPEFLYPSESSIFGPLHPLDNELVERLRTQLVMDLPSQCQIVSPLSLGNHVDHQLVRKTLESLGRPLWYYADYPYVLNHTLELEKLEQGGWKHHLFPISPEGLFAWQRSITAHRSQISTFWNDLPSMREAIESYLVQNGGLVLWKWSSNLSGNLATAEKLC